jgi:serine/threonine-protein kinase
MHAPQDLIGKKLQGKLVITDLLGEGAMGIVYRGFDEVAQRAVAVKVLQPQLAMYPELVVRFYREGAAARRVDHESAVCFLDKGEDAGLHFLVMELLEGRSLSAVLEAERRIGQVRAARVLIQICDVLAAAHERGVVHRDLKPDNVMVSGSPDGEHVKLLDFGIAKRVGPAGIEDSFSTAELTGCGALIGTPEYMSPEQCRGLDVDARSDVYACGVLLYRLVTGRVPFTADHPLEVCQLHLGEPPRPPSLVVPGIHPAIEAVILEALQKDPNARPQSAGAMRAKLARALEWIAEDEAAPTGVMDRASLLEAESAPRETVTPPEPGIHWREHVPMLAACAAIGVGMASLLMKLSVLFH